MDVVGYIAEQLSQITAHVGEKYPQRKWLYEGRYIYWHELAKAKETGKPVAWAGVGGTPEILAAMGMLPFAVGDVPAVLSIVPGGVAKYIDIAQRYVPDHSCSINKSLIGLAISGDLPPPDLIVACATCDSGYGGFTALADYFGVPSFCIDSPYGKSERDFQYMADELGRLISFVEQKTGNKLDMNKFREVVHHANQAWEVLNEINELRKIKPCPLSGRILLLTEAIVTNLIGMPNLVGYLKVERAMALEKVKKGEGHLKNERIRVAWVQIPISFDVGIWDWMEEKHGATVVMDMMSYWKVKPVDASEMSQALRGFAEMLLSWPMLHDTRGPADYWIDTMIEMCREYKANAAICAGHVGCKRYWAAAALLKERIADELGIPTLVLDVDTYDSRIRSSESVKREIDEFLSILS